MWIATTFGFFSVVRDQTRDGWVQVRARQQAHLTAYVRRFYGRDRNPPKIITTTDSDYRWRIKVLHKEFLRHLVAFGEVAYQTTNFKNAVRDKRPDDQLYQRFLHGCWDEGYNMQLGAVEIGHRMWGTRPKHSRTLFGEVDDMDVETGQGGTIL